MTAAAATGTARRAALLAVGAFLLYGGWAFVANHGHGVWVALGSAVVQGAMSLVATGASAVVLEQLFQIGRVLWVRTAIASLGTQALVLGAMSATHALAGTPEIAATLAPVAIIGFVYFTSYASWLSREELKRRVAALSAADPG